MSWMITEFSKYNDDTNGPFDMAVIKMNNRQEFLNFLDIFGNMIGMPDGDDNYDIGEIYFYIMIPLSNKDINSSGPHLQKYKIYRCTNGFIENGTIYENMEGNVSPVVNINNHSLLRLLFDTRRLSPSYSPRKIIKESTSYMYDEIVYRNDTLTEYINTQRYLINNGFGWGYAVKKEIVYKSTYLPVYLYIDLTKKMIARGNRFELYENTCNIDPTLYDKYNIRDFKSIVEYGHLPPSYEPRKIIRESITNVLKPKSEEEISSQLRYMNVLDKYNFVIRHKYLPDKYLPTDKEIMDELRKSTITDWIRFVKRHKFPDKFMPTMNDVKNGKVREDYEYISDIMEEIKFIHQYRLPKKYLPPYHDIKLLIKSMKSDNPGNDKVLIKFIIKHQLPFDLLPRNWRGRCIYDGDLGLGKRSLEKLPKNLTVKGNLWIRFNNLTELPRGLVVTGQLDCSWNKLTSIPNDIRVGRLICNMNAKKLELPRGAKVYGDFIN